MKLKSALLPCVGACARFRPPRALLLLALLTRYSVAVVLLLAGPRVLASGPSEVRVREDFSGGWLFARQHKGTGELGSFDRQTAGASKTETRFRGAAEPGYDDSSWEEVDLPHTWNAHDVSDEKAGYWRGIGWYRKHFRLDPKFAGKKFCLEFDGANAVAEAWLNGKYLGRHLGGYTPFSWEITPRTGALENVLTVKVDNLFRDTVPPTVKSDYNFYGGLHRKVWLRITGPVFVADVFWRTPHVSATTAEVEFHTQITNQSAGLMAFDLLQEVLDANGKLAWPSVTTHVKVQAGQTADFLQSSKELDRPQLWSPETPYLYHIRTTLKQDGRVLDSTEVPLGFRWFRFDPQDGFFLNGKRVQVRGTNWHETYPGMGSAMPDSRIVKDVEMVHQMGANFWRTSHYPHAPASLDASDRIGLLVWEELPINKEIGDPEAYIGNASRMAVEMIKRDRNHPSVVLWGFAGEVNAPKRVSLKVIDAISKLYRQLDPTRKVAMHAPRGEDVEALVDVSGAGAGSETDEKHIKYPDRSYMESEYTVARIERGRYGGGPESEELGIELHERYLKELNLRRWMAGGNIWNQIDYDGETYDSVVPHMVSFGVVDIWRIPKEVYYFYQSQWTDTPMVHIVGHWAWPGEEGKIKNVIVCSNVEQVELFLNGQSLGTKTDSPVPGVTHPLRVWQVPFQPGTLKAVATAKSGGKTINYEIRTAGPAVRILLETDSAHLTSGDRDSLAYITASVVDESGTVVQGAHPVITFTSYGPGRLLEQTWLGHGTGLTWNAVDGKTRVAFQATSRSGEATISAYSPGLQTGRTSVTVTAPGKPDEMNYKERFDHDELP